MRPRLSTEQLLALGFVFLSIGSAVYITAATINYLSFFPALAQLDAQTNEVNFSATSTGPALSATVTVRNPSGYSGFTVNYVSVQLYMVHPNATGNQTLWEDTPNPLYWNLQPNQNLAPRSSLVFHMPLTLSPQNLTSLIGFNRSFYGQIYAHVLLTVYILTFLNPVTGRTALVPVQEIPLSSKPSG